jgi:hypothetical protein
LRSAEHDAHRQAHPPFAAAIRCSARRMQKAPA